MKPFHLFLVAGAAASLSACFGSDDKIVIDEPGPVREETRDVAAFDEVEVAGPFKVVVTDGDFAGLTISGPENILAHTEIEVDDGELEISLDKGYRLKRGLADDSVEIRFAHGTLKEASIAGSGRISIASTRVEDFEGSVAGSGKLDIDALIARRADFDIAGSGTIAAKGAVSNMELDIAGSGEFLASELEAVDAGISIAGSGDVEARVTGKASISIAGSGDVAVTGGAECSVSKAGSGNVTCS